MRTNTCIIRLTLYIFYILFIYFNIYTCFDWILNALSSFTDLMLLEGQSIDGACTIDPGTLIVGLARGKHNRSRCLVQFKIEGTLHSSVV